MSFELGGFAESPEVIEGTEEEFNAFNWSLACDYHSAVIGEDFDALGDVLNDVSYWHDLMDQVGKWLNYDGEIGKEYKDDIPKLYDGTIITCEDRTFIDACYEHGWTELADGLTKELEPKKSHFHIGVIGRVDHSKMTLSQAIQMMEEGKREDSDYPFAPSFLKAEYPEEKPSVKRKKK